MMRMHNMMLFSYVGLFILAHGYTRIVPSRLMVDGRRGYRKSVLLATSISSPTQPIAASKKRMPITVLSGFLGSGKTSFLQHALENDKGTKFGLLINDMASVNVDSKLIKKTSSGFDGIDTLELQNGCVCCTLAEDLIFSISKLIEMSEQKNVQYDHIIVECSGIAEPRKIRELFQAAEDYGDQLLEKVSLDTLVTIVDASIFLQLFGTAAEIKSFSTLAVTDTNQELLDENAGMRKITDLLLEQVECADTVLINKIDLITDPKNIELVTKVIKSMNPNAKVLSCVRGVIDPTEVIGSAKGLGAASWGILDEHRNLIKSVETGHALGATHGEEGHVCDSTCDEHQHQHSHEHSHDHSHSATAEQVTTQPAHGEVGHTCDTTCNDDHNHSHDHNHDDSSSSTCNHPSHNHDHDHGVCNDPTHDHSHSHEHAAATTATTAETRFGITSFVYKRRRPFHPGRFTTFLQSLGKLSMQGLSDYAIVDNANENDARARLVRSEILESAKRSLLRSKGFVWMATSAAGAYFMSHAGQYLELIVLGRWWSDINEEEWPETSKSEILLDFDGQHGDRRQELVFIGQFENNDKNGNSQEALEEVLDSCLLTDEEMKTYEETYKKGDQALRTLFFKNF